MFRQTLIFLTIFLLTNNLICQDTNTVWLRRFDTTKLKISFDKNLIPKYLYSSLYIDTISEIVNPSDTTWRPGCTTGDRLNWIAKDKNNHWVVSISVGGRGVWTNYYFIETKRSKIIIVKIFGHRGVRDVRPLPLAIRQVKLGQLRRMDDE